MPVELVIDHSVHRRRVRHRRRLRRNAELEFTATGSATASCAGARRRSTTSASCRPTPASATRSTSSTWPAWCSSTTTGWAYPDTLVGTDSHTPMVNGLGVARLGRRRHRGRGGHARPAALDAHPAVVGVRLVGELPEGATATDLVLTVAELLRRHGVVGKFVEFYGPGVANVPLENRATIGNMSPEYGSTIAMFPIDAETLRYLRFTGRPRSRSRWSRPTPRSRGCGTNRARPSRSSPRRSSSTCRRWCPASPAPPPAGPRAARPRRRRSFRAALPGSSRCTAVAPRTAPTRRRLSRSRPATRRRAASGDGPATAADSPAPTTDSRRPRHRPCRSRWPTAPVRARPRRRRHRRHHQLHQHVQPVGDGGRRAAGQATRSSEGLTTKPWVKTSLAPGLPGRHRLLRARRACCRTSSKLGFNLVGFGCTTCIGNSGRCRRRSPTRSTQRPRRRAVLSGNRNFEGRINPDVRMNYLASPPLVVAYALAGTMDIDLDNEPLGAGADGEPVFLRDIWPTPQEMAQTSSSAVAVGDVPPGLRRASSRATSAGAASTSPGRPLRVGRVDLRPPPAVLRRHARRTRRRCATSSAPGCWRCSATASPPTTSRLPASIKPDGPAGP